MIYFQLLVVCFFVVLKNTITNGQSISTDNSTSVNPPSQVPLPIKKVECLNFLTVVEKDLKNCFEYFGGNPKDFRAQYPKYISMMRIYAYAFAKTIGLNPKSPIVSLLEKPCNVYGGCSGCAVMYFIRRRRRRRRRNLHQTKNKVSKINETLEDDKPSSIV